MGKSGKHKVHIKQANQRRALISTIGVIYFVLILAVHYFFSDNVMLYFNHGLNHFSSYSVSHFPITCHLVACMLNVAGNKTLYCALSTNIAQSIVFFMAHVLFDDNQTQRKNTGVLMLTTWTAWKRFDSVLHSLFPKFMVYIESNFLPLRDIFDKILIWRVSNK